MPWGACKFRCAGWRMNCDLCALDEHGVAAMPRVKVMARAEATNSPLQEMTADNAWPYLAI